MDKKLNRNYKVIILDVDGTLTTLGQENQISHKVKETILKSNKKIHVGIASGRPLARVTFLFEELKLKIPCVVSGGAQIVDPVTRKILWERSILKKDLADIFKVLDAAGEKVWVVDGTQELQYYQGMNIDKPMNFFFTRIKTGLADQIIDELSRKTLAVTKEVAYKEGYVALKITHAGATKQHAIEKVAEILKVKSEDIIGVGDGHNDFHLFNACGLRVAVGNAIPSLKEIAHYVAPSVTDDGVAHIFEKFIVNPFFPKPEPALAADTATLIPVD